MMTYCNSTTRSLIKLPLPPSQSMPVVIHTWNRQGLAHSFMTRLVLSMNIASCLMWSSFLIACDCHMDRPQSKGCSR